MSTLANQDDIEEEDRISNLLDDILITILSLIPINSAAATSALSQRWGRLWTRLTHISLPPPPSSPSSPSSPTSPFHTSSFVATVDHILSQLHSLKIHSFKLHLLRNAAGMDMLKLASWIRQVCFRQPEIIQVFGYISRHQNYKVPTCILQTRSLVQLELNYLLGFDNIPDDDDDGFSINLPNLKKLKVSLYGSDRWLMRNLCKSCPLLEDLDMSILNLDHDHDVDISAPNLKFLEIYVGDTSCLSNVLTFVIHAPMLERFLIEGYLMYFNFVEKPTRLQQVKLSIHDSVFDSDYRSRILVLFRGIQVLFQGISCAEYLILDGWEADLLSLLGEVGLPEFSNLIHLNIVHCDKDKEWDSFPCLPAFLLANLEQLDLENLVVNNDLQINMIQDILSKATVLKRLHVHELILESDEEEEDRLLMEHDFCIKLFTLSERSLSCHIEVFGRAIIASSEDFKDCLLKWQINKNWFKRNQVNYAYV